MRVFNMSGLPQTVNDTLSLIAEELPSIPSNEKSVTIVSSPKKLELTVKQINETGEKFNVIGFLRCDDTVEAYFISKECLEGEIRLLLC